MGCFSAKNHSRNCSSIKKVFGLVVIVVDVVDVIVVVLVVVHIVVVVVVGIWRLRVSKFQFGTFYFMVKKMNFRSRIVI